MAGGGEEEGDGGGGGSAKSSGVRDNSSTHRDRVEGDVGEKGEGACGYVKLGECGRSCADRF